MAPADRRRAIIAATLPLLEQHGAEITTRQIAEAAGIAEGTIFRVFPDKQTLIRDSIDAIFDPDDAIAQLDLIDRSAPLDQRLLAVVTQLAARLDRIFHLMMQLRTLQNAGPPPGRPPQSREDPIMVKVQEILQPDADRFRHDLDLVGKLLRLLTFAGSHPRMTGEAPLAPSQIVDLFLHGTLNPTSGLVLVTSPDHAPAPAAAPENPANGGSSC